MESLFYRCRVGTLLARVEFAKGHFFWKGLCDKLALVVLLAAADKPKTEKMPTQRVAKQKREFKSKTGKMPKREFKSKTEKSATQRVA